MNKELNFSAHSHIIAVSEKEFKLLIELPEEPTERGPKFRVWLDWYKIYQQAIDSAPFIRNIEVAWELINKAVLAKSGTVEGITFNHPYKVDLSNYDVSEPNCSNECGTLTKTIYRIPSTCKKFVTITPKSSAHSDEGGKDRKLEIPFDFEFTDQLGTKFKVRYYESSSDWWLHYKHPDGQWVTQRTISLEEARYFYSTVSTPLKVKKI